MKVNLCLLFILASLNGMVFIPVASAQPATQSAHPPDLQKIPAYPDKVKALIDYCEKLQKNTFGVANNYVLLSSAAIDALQLTRPEDAENRSLFAIFAAVGEYYQLKFDSAQFYFYMGMHAAQKAHDTRQIVRACVSLIPLNFQLQQNDKVDECKNILQSIVDTTRDLSNREDGYSALGTYYQQKSYYSTAQDYFIKSIELREKELDTLADPQKKFSFAIQNDMLSKLYLNTEMADKSLDALRKGARYADASAISNNRILSSFVEAFTTSGHIDSALYYNKQLDVSVGNPMLFPSEVISSDLNIAIYYIDHKQYEKALPYIQKSDTLAVHTQSPLMIFQVQMTKGRYLAETGKYDQAISYLNQSMPIAKQYSKELYGNILKSMAIAYKGKGNAGAALRYYEQYVDVNDSLSKEKLSRTFADLETHYQTHEKELRIASLDKENRVNVLELENASRTRLLLILGLAALGIISLLLYFIYRNKEKLNKALNDRNDQLDKLNRELAEANETKARLFGIISHDLRSPVGKIVRLLQIQNERPDLLNEEARKRHEDRLKRASENVLETMEDLLLWSKSQMQHFTPEFRPVRVADVVQKEIALFQEHQEEGGLRIDCRVPDSFVQNTDENFLAVIVRNLLQNAVKYSDGNRVITIASSGHKLTIANPASSTQAEFLNRRLDNTQVNSKASGLGLQIAADLATRIHTRLFFREEAGHELTAVLSWEPSLV
jgi:signal transduction histidine kinase